MVLFSHLDILKNPLRRVVLKITIVALALISFSSQTGISESKESDIASMEVLTENIVLNPSVDQVMEELHEKKGVFIKNMEGYCLSDDGCSPYSSALIRKYQGSSILYFISAKSLNSSENPQTGFLSKSSKGRIFINSKGFGDSKMGRLIELGRSYQAEYRAKNINAIKYLNTLVTIALIKSFKKEHMQHGSIDSNYSLDLIKSLKLNNITLKSLSAISIGKELLNKLFITKEYNPMLLDTLIYHKKKKIKGMEFSKTLGWMYDINLELFLSDKYYILWNALNFLETKVFKYIKTIDAVDRLDDGMCDSFTLLLKVYNILQRLIEVYRFSSALSDHARIWRTPIHIVFKPLPPFEEMHIVVCYKITEETTIVKWISKDISNMEQILKSKTLEEIDQIPCLFTETFIYPCHDIDMILL